MNIEFSTTQSNYVAQYLKHKDFNWLNDKQKEYVLANIGDIRVQDPMMYFPARLAIHNNGELHTEKIRELGSIPKITVINQNNKKEQPNEE